MNFLKAYFHAATVSLSSKFIAIFANIALLWLAARILDKSEFGVFMVALAVVSLLGMVLAGPFCSIILFHGSRLKNEPDQNELGHELTGRVMSWVIIFALLVTGLMTVSASLWSDIFDMPNLDAWLYVLSPMVILEALRRVMAAWHRARQEVQISITYNEIWPNVLKAGFLIGAYLFSPHIYGMAFALNLSLLVPVIAIFMKDPVYPNLGRKVFTEWDIKYGLKNLFTYGLNQQSRGFDLILVGALSSAVIAADYAIASRFGRLLLVGKQGLSQLLAPRLGAHFGSEATDMAAFEFKIMRFIGFAIATLGALAMLVLGEWGTSLFCDTCDNAYPVLLILSAAFVVNTSFGSLEDYMTMAGHAGWNLGLSIVSTTVMVLMSIILIPYLGGSGAAFAVLAAFAVRGIAMTLAVRRLDGVMLVTTANMTTAFAAAGVLVGAAYDQIGTGLAFFLIVLITILPLDYKKLISRRGRTLR